MRGRSITCNTSVCSLALENNGELLDRCNFSCVYTTGATGKHTYYVQEALRIELLHLSCVSLSASCQPCGLE